MNFTIDGKMDIRILSRGGFDVDSSVSRDIKGKFYAAGSVADLVETLRVQVLTLIWDRLGLTRGSGVPNVEVNAEWIIFMSSECCETVMVKVNSSEVSVSDMMGNLNAHLVETARDSLQEREEMIRDNISKYNRELTDIENTLCQLPVYQDSDDASNETTEEDVPF